MITRITNSFIGQVYLEVGINGNSPVTSVSSLPKLNSNLTFVNDTFTLQRNALVYAHYTPKKSIKSSYYVNLFQRSLYYGQIDC